MPEIRRLLFDAPVAGNEYLGAEVQPWVGWVVDNGQWMNEQSDDDSSFETEDVNNLLTGTEVLADYPANYYVVSELSEFDAQIDS